MIDEKIKLMIKNAHFIKQKPLLFFSLLKGFFKGVVLKKSSLRMFELQVTFKCNSKCVMCSASDFTERPDEFMSLKEIKSVWKQARSMGANMVTLTGGEPSIRPDILDIIRAVDPHRTLISMTSNSLGLTKEFIIELKKAGLDILAISLDGLTAEENDRIRGIAGHFEKALQAIEYGKAAGLRVGISHTVTAKNLDSLGAFVDFAEENDLNFGPILLVPIGKATEMKEILTPETFEKFEKFRLARNLRVDYALNYGLKKRCDAGWEKLCISAYGDVFGCNLVHISFGNVKDESLKHIREKMLSHPLYNRSFPGCPGAIDNKIMQPDYLANLGKFDRYPPTIEELDSLKD